MPITALTPVSITIATLAFLVAFSVNAFNTGKVFGLVTVPQTWLPYLGVGVPFIGAIAATVQGAGVLSGAVLFNALQAGLFALLASAGGAGTHTVLARHVNAPIVMKKAMALAAKMHGLPLLVLMLGGFGGLAMACQGCMANGQPSPAGVAGIDLGLCILEGYANTPSCRPTPAGNWAQCVGVLATQCGSDAAGVERILTAQKKAALADQK